jgi:putative nucleotidyltransferase with HDIG domain/PAS domain S-box-containing protein
MTDGAQRLRVLCLEDSPADADLVSETLSRAGYELDLDLAENRAAFERLLVGEAYDVILADFSLPGFDAHGALELANAACPGVPFICVSGTIGEEATVELLKNGANDIVLKSKLARLPFAVQRALHDAAHAEDLAESEQHFRSLVENLLNGYAYCRMIYDEAGEPVDFVYLDVNPAFELLTGLKDVKGRPVSEVVPGIRDLSPEVLEVYGRVARTGKPETITLDFKSLGLWLFITVYSQKPGYFVALFDDITERRQTLEDLLSSSDRLRRTVEGAVEAMGSMIAARDPYTAGHEKRVAELAVVIAAEMGRDEATIDGLRLAGLVHDVGKLTIPAEILNKPSLLSPIEFELIKGHSAAAYEILKSIEFDYPIADIVVQHHERLDGSGYPAGLKGDEILPEARILAIADVVEAMASHRPYRAALGVEAALAEVRAGAGTRYEAAAVAACERVFERGFVFDDW